MKKILYGYYATRIYLPLSGLSRKWRRLSKRLMNKDRKLLQQVNLPEVSWKDCTSKRITRIWEPDQKDGNIRISELAVINAIAADCEDGTNLFEIGTFDGRTSLNLAFSSPSNCSLYTLDLLPTEETLFPLTPGERYLMEKEMSGEQFEKYQEYANSIVNKIHRLFGDSASFDFSPYKNVKL